MPYLDHAATVPVRPVAREALMRALEDVGNAASPHANGRRALRLVDAARGSVAALLGRKAAEVVWTSGGTEANNLALLGSAARASGRHMIVSAIEHRSVLGPAKRLAEMGWAIDRVPVDGDGVVRVDVLESLLRPDTVLVSVMAVNNEVGSRQPLHRVAEVVTAAGARLHVDASQAAYEDLGGLDADLVTLSAHKLGGPTGVGALLVRPGVQLASLMAGGAHERGLRPGTLNVAGIAGFGAAAQELVAVRAEEGRRVAALRDELARRVLASVPGARWLGRPEALAPHFLALALPGLEGEALVTQLDLMGLAASTGAACTTLGTAPGHVLPAMGLDAASVAGSLRLSLGWGTTQADVDDAAITLVQVAGSLLTMKPMVPGDG